MSEPLLAKLESGWLVLAEDGRSLVLVSPVHAEGMVAPLFTSRQLAETAAQSYRGGEEFEPYPMPSLWETAQSLAAQGFAGLLVDEALPLFFVTTAPGSTLPTHVAIPQVDDFLVVDETGETPLGKEDVVLWTDLTAFDQLSIEWLMRDRLPFVGYETNMPLWEYLLDGEPVPLEDKGVLLEEEEKSQAAIAFFSTEFAAGWYWETLMVGMDVEDRVVGHHNVPSLLEARANTGLALILNPGRHRFHQGFFRKAGDAWYLVTINGVWLVEPPFRCTQVAQRRFDEAGG